MLKRILQQLRYRQLGGDSKYNFLYDKLCETMNRRITASPTLNLQTYPGECIYIPDMLVAIIALENYSRQSGGKYHKTVQAWLDYMQEYWIDESSGLLASMIPVHEYSVSRYPVKGSYSSLNCYYLTFIDDVFAYGQYLKLKENFLQKIFLQALKRRFMALTGWDMILMQVLYYLI